MMGVTFNEYAQAVPGRLGALGLSLGPIITAPQSPNVKWQGTPNPVRLRPSRPTRTMELSGTGTVLATYSSGASAAVQVSRGAGSVIVVGFELGNAYQALDTGIPFPGFFPTFYQASVRSILLSVASELGLDPQRPVWTSEPLVEVARVNHAGGGAVVLLNYKNQPVSNLRVTIPGVSGWVTSRAQRVNLPVTPAGVGFVTAGTVELDLKDMDILTWGLPSLQGAL